MTETSALSQRDIESGWHVHTLSAGNTRVQVVPEAGCNVCSIEVDGIEFLRTAPAITQLPGTKFGVPVLYPTPNRVRESVMTWGGREYRYPPNNGPHFLHGLAHSRPWEVLEVRELADRRGTTPPAVELDARLGFGPGEPKFALFPHPHQLLLSIRVAPGVVRWTYTVDNTEGQIPVPFGFGLHPWFRHIGPRSATFLSVPATHWMEAFALIPTGVLADLEGSPYDLRAPRMLDDFHIDDVYFGITPDKPSRIEYRAAGREVELAASDDFTHMVVFTPADRGAFCVENQTCSTNAHNLDNAGLKEPAHLLVVEPGQTHSGWVEFRFRPMSAPIAK